MKRILITGADSFIGVSFENYIKKFGEQYSVDTLDMIGEAWKEKDFSVYDVVFHVAGLAHADVGNVSEETKSYYYKINTDLAVESAKKAKDENVNQFIFMSSAIVYGESARIGESRVITKNTTPMPANFYGDSKLQAEKGMLPLQDAKFNVVVLRPPMIYGKGGKGNYPVLSKLAQKLPVFPYVKNERSVLYIENLCEFIRLMIDNEEKGIFHPQNSEYANTTDMVKIIAQVHGRKIMVIKGFEWLLKMLGNVSGYINKAFGSFTYDMKISEYKDDYRVCGLRDSIERTE